MAGCADDSAQDAIALFKSFELPQAARMMEQSPAEAGRPRWRWLVWLLAALGVAAALALVLLVAMLNRQTHRPPPAEVAAATKQEVLEIGDVDRLKGTNLIRIEIGLPQDKLSSGSYKGSYPNLRNILLLDQTSGESRRLLPDNKTPIIEAWFAPAAATNGERYDASEGSAKDQPPAYYVLQLARGEGDKRTVAVLVGELAGYRQAIVMEGLEGIDRMWMIDGRQLGLIVREKRQLQYRVVDIPAQKMVRSQRIRLD